MLKKTLEPYSNSVPPKHIHLAKISSPEAEVYNITNLSSLWQITSNHCAIMNIVNNDWGLNMFAIVWSQILSDTTYQLRRPPQGRKGLRLTDHSIH